MIILQILASEATFPLSDHLNYISELKNRGSRVFLSKVGKDSNKEKK